MKPKLDNRSRYLQVAFNYDTRLGRASSPNTSSVADWINRIALPLLPMPAGRRRQAESIRSRWGVIVTLGRSAQNAPCRPRAPPAP